MEENDVYIIGVMETWRFGQDQTYDRIVSGMRAFGLNHPNGRRGVAVYTRRELKIRYIKEYCMELEDCELITAQIGDMIVVFTYLPDGSRTKGIDAY